MGDCFMVKEEVIKQVWMLGRARNILHDADWIVEAVC